MTYARSAPIGNPPRGGRGAGEHTAFRVFHLLRGALGAMSVSVGMFDGGGKREPKVFSRSTVKVSNCGEYASPARGKPKVMALMPSLL